MLPINNATDVVGVLTDSKQICDDPSLRRFKYFTHYAILQWQLMTGDVVLCGDEDEDH